MVLVYQVGIIGLLLDFSNGLIVNFCRGILASQVAKGGYAEKAILFPYAFSTTFVACASTSKKAMITDLGGSSLSEVGIGGYATLASTADIYYHLIAIGY